MAVPKRKTSHSRQGKRRSSVWKLSAPDMVECPNCHELTAPHKVCSNCGFYDGKEPKAKKTLSNLVVKKRRLAFSFCFNGSFCGKEALKCLP